MLLGLAVLLRLTCAIAAPRLILEPNPLVLPPPTGTESRAELTLRNGGDAPLSLAGASLSPDASGYRIESAAPIVPGEILPPGSQRQLTLVFTPTPGRRGGYGAVLVYSSDPRGQLDPRGQTPHRVLAAGLRCQESPALLWLWLSPLLPLAIALLWPRRLLASRRSSRWRSYALTGSALVPLAGLAGLFRYFVRGFGALHGDYGMQFVLQRVLSARLGLSYQAGLDGGSLLLGLALALWGALALGLGELVSTAIPRERAEVARQQTAALAGLLAAGLGTLVALDVHSLLGFFGLALAATLWALPAQWRRPLLLPFGGGWVALASALLWLTQSSLPTTLSDGYFVAHAYDVVKLSYQNYFGDLRPPSWLPSVGTGSATGSGGSWAGLAYLLLSLGSLLPVSALVIVTLRRPLRAAGAALRVLPALAILGFALLIRLPAGLLPQLHARYMPVWAMLAVCGLALAVIAQLQPAARRDCLDRFGPLVPLPIAGALLGLAGGTETGLQAALLLLLASALSIPWLGTCLHNASLARTPGVEPHGSAREAAAGDAALREALVPILSPPGTLPALGVALCTLSSFAALRGLTLLYAGLCLGASAWALSGLLRLPRLGDASQASVRRYAGYVLLGASVVASFSAQPLFEVGHTWAQDFIAHTSHVSAPPGPGLFASIQQPSQRRSSLAK